jgi:hypothetical protein
MKTLYTFGYLSAKAERMINEFIAVKTPLVDIRFSPTSRNVCMNILHWLSF